MKAAKTVFKLSLLLAAVLSTNAFAQTSTNSGKVVFGYYANWDIYGRNYQPEDTPIQDLNAILYSFAQVGNCASPYATDDNPGLCNTGPGQSGVQDYQLHSTDYYADFYANWGKGAMARTINTAHAQHKNVLLSVGGYSLSVPLTTAMDSGHQYTFIQSIISFLNNAKADNPNKDGFDGIDIDYEPTGNQWNLSQTQIQDYVSFLGNLHTALQSQYASYAWLTIAAPANPDVVRKIGATNWQKIAGSVDYINVMAYDYHGGFDNPQITNLQAPLTFDANQPQGVVGRETFNVAATIQAYKDMGVPMNKLVLGFPLYGRAVDGVPNKAPDAYPKAYGLYQSFSSIPQGEWDATGTFDYRYIISQMLGKGYADYNVAGAAAAYNPQNGYFISYDNVDTVGQKAAFVNSNALGGMMAWELSGDVPPSDSSYASTSLVHRAASLLSVGK
ncbi:MAG: class chitinase ChiB1 [Gammaproteobacteria bacterium]|jgi:chitinase|nr:class chitinase ChiB1 [Gammaproteobacteria bacterium]